MKVIFLQDVPGVAKAGELKEVADGYGRNFLIPKEMALVSKPGVARMIEHQRQITDRKQGEREVELLELAHQLEEKEIKLEARIGAKDRLYGSITSADIASEIQNNIGVTVDKRKIELAEPIHQLGSYDVAIRLAKDIVPKVKVVVMEKEMDEVG